MVGDIFTHILVALLCCMLVFAACTDVARREIDNGLNAAIALLAPVFWFASGYSLWPDMAIQLAIGAAVFAIFAVVFAFGAMGGGDVKMLGALALWLPIDPLMTMLFVMAIAGGVLTVAMLIAHKAMKSEKKLEIPYGVAIAFAGLWVQIEPYLNQFD